MTSNFTLFTSDSSSQSTGNAFDQDAFSDISLAATNNSGLTDNSSTNPMSQFFANDDGVRYGPKTLYIKDLVMVQDHALWIQGKPTYQIIWNENFPQIQGYIYGNFQIVSKPRPADGSTGAQKYIAIRQAGDGISITGVIRKCGFIVTGDTAASATAQLAVDGANTSTIDFSNMPYAVLDENGNPETDNKYNLFLNSTALQTNDLHTYQLSAIQTGTLRLVGIVVYHQNSGSNVQVFNGTTYVNKNKVATNSGATFSVPSYTGNLGGRALIYKSQAGGYSLATQAAMNITSSATGSSGTNLLTVTTGTGASFLAGSGIAAFFGTTGFVGSVTNRSTDTLTVSPTLSFGISGQIYKLWSGGQSLAINSSQMILSKVYDLNLLTNGFTNYYSDPSGQFRVWGFGIGFTLSDSIWPSLVATNTSLGFLQVDGFFSAADIEFVGQGILHATFGVNGHPIYNINAGQTGCVKKTVFTDAGPGWNSFNIGFGASYNTIGINRINLYERALPQGISYGLLAMMDTLPGYVAPPAGSINATTVTPGTYKRYFADELFTQGGWVRGSTTQAAGGVHYLGASLNSVLKFQFYGQQFAVLGINNGSSLVMTIDGGANQGITLNTGISMGTEDFHSIVITTQSGGTFIFHGVDIMRSKGEIRNLQGTGAFSPATFPQYQPLSLQIPRSPARSEVVCDNGNGFGSSYGFIRRFVNAVVTGTAIGYSTSSAFGDAFVINEDGVYSVAYNDFANSGQTYFGITRNTTQPNGNPATATNPSEVLALTQITNVANTASACSVTKVLNQGDVIRAHTGSTGLVFQGGGGLTKFSICKVSS